MKDKDICGCKEYITEKDLNKQVSEVFFHFYTVHGIPLEMSYNMIDKYCKKPKKI